MIYIQSDSNNTIKIISSLEIAEITCTIDSLPDDFYRYLGEGKYFADAVGLHVKAGWIDYDMLDIPTGAMVDYIMTSPCPKDPTLTRHIYWVGERHESNQCFTIKLLALHFNADGTRNRRYDCKTWTRADKGMMMDNPLNPTSQVDEYDFFVSMIGSTFMPELVQLGIYSAENVLNTRIYENAGN